MKLGNIGDWGAGATPNRSNKSYYENGDVLWVKTGELNDGYIFDSIEKITTKALNECSLRNNNIGDVLIAMYGATIGKLGIAAVPLTTNQACCACTPFSFINNEYLFYYLMAIKPLLISKSYGGAQPNISKEKITNCFINFPKIDEQILIVNKIKELFKKIETIDNEYNSIINLISATKRKVLEEIFGENSSYKSYYKPTISTNLSELIPNDNIGDGDWVLTENMDENGNYSLIQLKHVGYGQYIEKAYKHVNQSFFETNNCKEIKEDYILINRLIADKMNVCILPQKGFKCITAVDICWIAPSQTYNQKYIMYYLMSPTFQNKVKMITSGTTRKRISKTNLIKIPMLIHEHNYQSKIVEEIENAFKILDSIVS